MDFSYSSWTSLNLLCDQHESARSILLYSKTLGDEFDDRFRDYIAAKTNRDTFFPAQRFAIESGVLNRDNTVAALPTSSGKTLLAEMRIVAATGRYPDIRTVYLAGIGFLRGKLKGNSDWGC